MSLHARIHAAVTARQERAQAATPGPWSPPEPDDDGHWVMNGRQGTAEYAVGLTVPYNPRAEADAAFIAAENPAFVLAQCAEDLDVLARHAHTVVWGGNEPVGARCGFCGTVVDACFEIRSLARRYAISTEEDTDHAS